MNKLFAALMFLIFKNALCSIPYLAPLDVQLNNLSARIERIVKEVRKKELDRTPVISVVFAREAAQFDAFKQNVINLLNEKAHGTNIAYVEAPANKKVNSDIVVYVQIMPYEAWEHHYDGSLVRQFNYVFLIAGLDAKVGEHINILQKSPLWPYVTPFRLLYHGDDMSFRDVNIQGQLLNKSTADEITNAIFDLIKK